MWGGTLPLMKSVGQDSILLSQIENLRYERGYLHRRELVEQLLTSQDPYSPYFNVGV